MKVVSIVGMAGSGKSEVAAMFRGSGFTTVRFGDITDEEISKRGLELNEKNEHFIREQLREEYGMDAYAKLNLKSIEDAHQNADVVIDGLYSWEEYTFLKGHYGDDFIVVAVWSSLKARYARLGGRKIRPLTPQEATSRDRAEIENLNKGGPIALADFTIINESSLGDMKKEVERIID
ncbi:MAG: AAA family ATPase, partial [Dehalococcoidales bacterium]|nr:AAA family ATPase [Dehalococcoidales bacterium]